MQVVCPSCARTLDYTGDRPRFCSFCGSAIAPVSVTDVVTPEVPATCEQPTAAPADDGATGDRTAAAQDWATVDTPTGEFSALGRGVPETVGGYRLVRRLGGGGMGAVYEAEESASGRRVALKLLLPDIAGSGDALVRFRQEGQLASSVAHPRCVFVLSADEDAGRPFIVMELMPGSTLNDLVRQRGPLPPEEAVAKILDVVDGLLEAHRLGLVHRDVKPSNCFLETNGRVKIGDFGLARSLLIDGSVTRTGAFIGTPLYAAPEQIHKKEPTDAQSDVYSVSATLYFLLTGRAPFQTGDDAMATMARVVSDDPPPMRTLRPQLSRSLDRVVLRGLERDRKRRYHDLEELRAALLAFLPATPSVSGLGLRFVANLVDSALLYCYLIAAAWSLKQGLAMGVALVLCVYAAQLGGTLAYYGLLEGLLGWSLGKRLFRLRVGTPTSVQPPGILRAGLRSGFLFVMFGMYDLVTQVIAVTFDLPLSTEGLPPERVQELWLYFLTIGIAAIVWMLIAIGSALGTMRPQNGYRGLHEFISGTRTYHLRWPKPVRRRIVGNRHYRLPVQEVEQLSERVGSLVIRGALRWREDERLLLAEDPQLGRSLWLWMRPAGAPPLPRAWREINRGARMRWVSCGADGDWQWDAFVAPSGTPLPVLAAAAHGLTWGEVRPMLEDLAEELESACADGTLPPSLDVGQVWIQPDGRVQLVDMALMDGEGSLAVNTSASSGGEDRAAQALRLLAATALTALEGAVRVVKPGDAVRCPLPSHASDLLDRLLGRAEPYRSVAAFRQELEAARDRPVEVSRLRRMEHLGIMSGLMLLAALLPVFFVMMPATIVIGTAIHQERAHVPASGFVSILVVGCGVLWVGWAIVSRGGLAYSLTGIVLRRSDGRKAGRLQCGLRALLVFGPPVVLYLLAITVAINAPTWTWLYLGLWGAGTALLPLYLILALVFPTRSLHDRIVGTYLMPS